MILMSSSLFAIGTAAGVTINSFSDDVTINFSGSVGITYNILQSPQTTHTVLGVNGFNFSDIPTNNLLNPIYTNIYTNASASNFVREPIVNLSNQPVSISFQTVGPVKSISGSPGTLSNWNFSFINNNLIIDSDSATDNFMPTVIAASNAANGSIAAISVNVFINGTNTTTPNQQYTGYNGIKYAGYVFYQYQLNGVINAPLMSVVTRSVEVIAPTLNGYTGPENAAVPGSKLVHTIVIQNIGSGDAVSINISDYISQNGDNVEFLVGSASGTGSPSLTYFDPNSSLTPAGTVDWRVKKINWEFNTIPIGESRTVNYTVVIK